MIGKILLIGFIIGGGVTLLFYFLFFVIMPFMADLFIAISERCAWVAWVFLFLWFVILGCIFAYQDSIKVDKITDTKTICTVSKPSCNKWN